GISVYPEDGSDAATLVRHADTAMYHAKEQGRNNSQFFSQALNRKTAQRLSLETRLRRALERNEFELYYQPQVDLDSERIVATEALLRWRTSEQTMISPAEFIPIAEATGLIVPIGQWVLHAACQQAVAWQQLGY